MKLTHPLSHPLFVAFTIQAVLAYEWLTAGWEKVSESQFMATIGKTLLRFGEGNPHTWYVNTLLRSASEHATLVGALVQWGEFFVGVGLIASLVLYVSSQQSSIKRVGRAIGILALSGGAIMNANFYFAAGWMSPSTSGLNAFMFWTQLILLISWIATMKCTLSKNPA